MDTMLEIAKRVDDFMMERSPVHDTMRRLAQTFSDLGIPFAIAGAMAANAHGLQDLADAIQLIRVNSLPRNYAGQLNPFVRVKFDELWQAAQVTEDY